MENMLIFLGTALMPFTLWWAIEALTQRKVQDSELLEKAYKNALERERRKRL